MLVDEANAVGSNLGWVNCGALWEFSLATGKVRDHPLSTAGHLRISPSADPELFLVLHDLAGRCAITLHRWRDPAKPVARVDIDGRLEPDGDILDRFPAVPTPTVVFLDGDAAGYHLIQIGRDDVAVRRLDWFDDSKYDHMNQSVGSVVELPTGELLFGVQRSSNLAMCDPNSLRVIREVPLAGRGGSPAPFLRAGGTEMWAVDYDTLVRLDAGSFVVRDRWLGQTPIDASGMFLGCPWLSGDGSQIVVPRPGSGDVVAVDAGSMQMVRRWRTGWQPLEAALLGGKLVARDWRSGELLSSPEDSPPTIRGRHETS